MKKYSLSIVVVLLSALILASCGNAGVNGVWKNEKVNSYDPDMTITIEDNTIEMYEASDGETLILEYDEKDESNFYITKITMDNESQTENMNLPYILDGNTLVLDFSEQGIGKITLYREGKLHNQKKSKATEYTDKDLIGTWVSPDADNQKLEIRTEELRFNYRTFDYEVKGNALHLEETYPNHSIIGDMPFELKGDTLTIDLGDEFSGYFYGRSGQVELERQ